MLGAIIGDVVGSVYEDQATKRTDFPLLSRFSRFTDDTVLTVAVADALVQRKTHRIVWVERRMRRQLYAAKLREYARKYPGRGYGQLFERWVAGSSARGYGSYGNGAAMRASPIGYAGESLEQVLREARLSAVVTHSHREGIKGAQAIAAAVYLARSGATKEAIREQLARRFKYRLDQRLDAIRPGYTFDSSCQGSVPQAIIAFLESNSYEGAIRNAISLGGDSDTLACMAGGIAQAYYRELPAWLVDEVMLRLDAGLKDTIREFMRVYPL